MNENDASAVCMPLKAVTSVVNLSAAYTKGMTA